MLENKIMVTSKTNSTVVVDVPELRLHRVWTQKEMTLPIDKDVFSEAVYNPGVSYLLREGILFVSDLEERKKLGLEEETATEETSSMIDLTDKLMLRMIKAMPEQELKDMLTKLTMTQREELGNFAVEHNADLKMDRIDLLSKACNRDILKSIENLRKADEIVKAK